METREFLKKAIKLNGDYTIANNFLEEINNEISQINNMEKKEAEIYFNDGIRAIYAGNYKKAYEKFTVSLAEYMPEKDGEMEDFQEVGELIMDEYSLISLYSNLILTAKKLDKFEDVLSYLVTINEISGPSAEIYYKIGKVYESKKYWQQANDRYKKALSMNSNISGLRSSLGYVYKKLGKYDDSVNQFEKALKKEPRNPVIMYNLGIMYKKIEKLNEAKEKLAKVKTFLKPGTKFYYTVEEHLSNLSGKLEK
jgi:tetratricopeptide (TPR) repeat protein